MDHMPWLLERSAANGNRDPSGHALMASCPPLDAPFANSETFAQQQQQQQQSASYTLSGHPGPTAANGDDFSSQGALPPFLSEYPSKSAGVVRSSGHQEEEAQAPIMDGNNSARASRTWELSKGDLNTLLDLSQKLPNADGEITPIGAWGMILRHARLGQLDEADFRELAEVLRSKVRCYG